MQSHRVRMAALLAGVAALVWAGVARAERELVDGIAAVVGDRVILESEVDQEMYLYQVRAGAETPPEQAQAVRMQLLHEMVDELLLVARAMRDTIVVEGWELDEEIERRLADVKARQGSEAAFQAALAREGMTETELKRLYRADVERRLLGQKVIDLEVRPKAEVTWAEVAAYYEEHASEVGAVPEHYEIAGILILPEVSESARRAATKRLDEALERLGRGESFESLARIYSDDPSAANGGNLGTFGPGMMVPEFEEAAFALGEGETSGIVETRFGLHLIQAVAKSGDTMRARHILARLAPGPDDDARAAALAESLRQRAVVGEDFAELARRYSDDARTAQAGGVLGRFAPDDLVPEFRAAVESLEPGGVSAVLRGDGGYYVLTLLRHEAARTATLDEIRPRLRQFLVDRRMEEEYQKLIDRLSREIYVSIRDAADPSP